MRQQNSAFHTILKLLPWDAFNQAIARHGGKDCARGFTYKSQLVAMLYAQLAGSASLRDVCSGLSSHANRLNPVHVAPARRSSLAEANRHRPVAVFSDLLAVLIRHSHRKLRRSMDGLTCLIDSTGLKLNELSSGWARFSATVCGAKLHVVYDPAADAAGSWPTLRGRPGSDGSGVDCEL